MQRARRVFDLQARGKVPLFALEEPLLFIAVNYD
jgi:hypothetical protein